MYPNYTPPQHLINLRLAVVNQGSVPRMSAWVVGVQYLLNQGASLDVAYAAQNANQILPYNYTQGGVTKTLDPATHKIDLKTVRLVAKALEARLAISDGGTSPATSRFYLDSLTTPNIMRMGAVGSHDNVKGSSLSSLLAGRPVAVGDLAYVTYSGVTKRRVVTGLIGVASASKFGSNNAYDDGLAANAATNPPTQASDAIAAMAVPVGWSVAIDAGDYIGTVQGATYNGKHGDAFTLEVITGGAPGVAQVSMVSDSGSFSTASITTVDDAGSFNIPGIAGVTVQLVPPGGTTTLTVGQVFRFNILGAYTQVSSVSTRLTLAGTYAGTKNSMLVVKVLTGTQNDSANGAVIEVSDTAGLAPPVQFTLANNVATAAYLGVTVKFNISGTLPQSGLRKGDIYTAALIASANSAVDFDRVVLDGPAVDLATYNSIANAVTVEFRIPFTGEVPASQASDGEAWTVAASGMTVQSGLSVFDSSRNVGSQWLPFVNGVGTIASIWRAAKLLQNSDGIIPINTVADITTNLGVIDPDNDLAYGAFCQLSASAGRRIYALNTGGTSNTDLSRALAKTERVDFLSYGALVSDGDDALTWKQLARTHALSMSAPERKNFRKFFGGSDLPGRYQALGDNPDTGVPYNATIADSGGGVYTLVTHNDPELDFTALNLSAGDWFVSGVTGLSYAIAEVLSATELRLASGPGAPVTVAQAFSLDYADTKANKIRFVQETAAAVSSEYFINVVNVGTAIGGDGEVIASRYSAAFVAGLRSAFPGQMGLSTQPVGIVGALPDSYNEYTDDDLNAMAAAGNTLITQAGAGEPCLIRHCVTTQTSLGVLYFEENSLSVLFTLGLINKDSHKLFPGKFLVNRASLAIIRKQFLDDLEDASKASLADVAAGYGPLIAGYRDATVVQNANMLNRVDERAQVGIQLPLLVVYTELTGYVDTVAA